MGKFFSIGNVIINKDNVINISTKFVKHDKKDMTDDDTEDFKV